MLAKNPMTKKISTVVLARFSLKNQIKGNSSLLNLKPFDCSSASVETRYSQLELKSQALSYGINQYHYHLEGIDKVTCYVDAKALLPFFDKENREALPRIKSLLFKS